ncbi:antA/AntB antirepressor family protein [Eubacterium callanderi]|uniref:Phage antirepressor protein n=1 Tax=Eubacterium callanderi TaxID=53442 RepID=E3GEJ4_9FIRM|nr:antA/AntB antirepressor family protein [Eubacterium callanderi]OEZ05774.1 AntA/AntB antirepressor [[Butyribacterium] methylotrophicum]ADO38110.1 phage antirepressor protein [Eubacterium callanderi]MCB6660127.1 antA/AntB antirepressor family protein [Eubacterium callanderi]MCB6753080.1 antA/AntB antirepressor family protein [Eubacterium callanderi]MCB7104762.1 antA/AntB antirepressor family protein [Eubacterium callanderi]
MNALKIFNSEVIPVYTSDTGEKVVIGRELHERLCIKANYREWFPRMCEYGFEDKKDYFSFVEKSTKPQNGGRPSKNHILTLDMAKHLAMIQRSEIGMKIRQKLIDLEKEISQVNLENSTENTKLLNARARVANAETRKAELLFKMAQTETTSKTYQEIMIAKAANIINGEELIPLPKVEGKTYTATEIAEILGVSPNKIGRTATRYNLKIPQYGEWYRDVTKGGRKEVDTFRYYENAIDKIRLILDEENFKEK